MFRLRTSRGHSKGHPLPPGDVSTVEKLFVRHASAVFIILKYYERDHLLVDPVLLQLQQEGDDKDQEPHGNANEKDTPQNQVLAEKKSAQTTNETRPQAKEFKFAKVDFSPDEAQEKVQDLVETRRQSKTEEPEPAPQEVPDGNTDSSSSRLKKKNSPVLQHQGNEENNQKREKNQQTKKIYGGRRNEKGSPSKNQD